MARHRLTDYEIREVSPAYAPAVARREPPDDPNGKVIVDVDAQLRGQDREDAIQSALLPYRQGWRALIPVPLLALMHECHRTAAAVAGAGVVAVIGVTTLVSDGIGDPVRPGVAAIATQTTEIIQPSPASPTSIAPTRSAWPDRSRPPADSVAAEPANWRTPKPVPESSQDATKTPAPRPTIGAAGTRPPIGRNTKAPTAASPTVEASPSAPRPTTSTPATADPAPEPVPAKPSPGLNVGVEVGVGGEKVVDVEVDVGDLEIEVGVGDVKIGVGDRELNPLGLLD
jgi:hypothetical protein